MVQQVSLWERVSGGGVSQVIREIPNLFATVDDADFDAVNQHRWRILRDKRADGQLVVKAVVATVAHRAVLLHHFVLALHGTPKPRRPLMVTFLDGNPLNNVLHNLRIMDYLEHSTRRRKLSRNKYGKVPTSRFKGVCWHTRSKRWLATARLNGVKCHLGSFSSEVNAAVMVNACYMTHHPAVPLPNPTAVPTSGAFPRCPCKFCHLGSAAPGNEHPTPAGVPSLSSSVELTSVSL